MISRNISLEDKLTEQLAAQVDYSDNEVTGAVLNALADMYKAAGDNKFAEAVKEAADKAIEKCTYDDKESLKNYELGKGFYSAYDVTGDEKYRDAAKKIAAQLDTQPRYEEGFFAGSQDNGVKKLCRTYMYTPFYMNYETRDGGKERYNDIIAQIRSYHNNMFDSYKDKLGSDEAAYNIVAHYAAALIDTMEVMDQMLYEIYHEMLDYYRAAVKAIAESGAVTGKGIKADYVFGYALLKGCRMKAVLTEKYEGIVIGLMDSLYESADNTYMLAMKAMYYSEAIRNREYQDYGRGKGGVLWS